MAGRKVKSIINQRFGNCTALKKSHYVGNNLNYSVECDCGKIFTTSGQQLRSGLTLACPACRKRKTRESREAEYLKRIEKANRTSVKYTLMNPEKTSIIRGRNGMHSYFDKTKARIAARILKAVVVPLSEAIIACRS